jgi:Carboxymuconolactone decarboxylase family
VTSPKAEAPTAETFDPAPPADPDSAATSQSAITAEIQEIEPYYRDSGVVELQPRLCDPPYRSTILRVARGHHDELAMHVRAARRNGLSVNEIKEVLLQAAIYCGVPDANTAFRIALAALVEEETTGEDDR